jgi:hypothetical protein
MSIAVYRIDQLLSWRQLVLLENALHHTRADTELPADLEDPVTAGLRLQDFRLCFGLNPTPAQFRSFPPRARR